MQDLKHGRVGIKPISVNVKTLEWEMFPISSFIYSLYALL